MRQLGSQWPVEYGVTKGGLVVRHQRQRQRQRKGIDRVWLRLNFSSCECNILNHCWMKPTRWMNIGNLRELTIIGWNWGRRRVLGIFNCWEGAQTNKPVRLQWPITDTIPTLPNIWMKCGHAVKSYIHTSTMTNKRAHSVNNRNETHSTGGKIASLVLSTAWTQPPTWILLLLLFQCICKLSIILPLAARTELPETFSLILVWVQKGFRQIRVGNWP